MFPDSVISLEYADIDVQTLSANVTSPQIVMLLKNENKQFVHEFQEYPSYRLNVAFPVITSLLNVKLNPELLKVHAVCHNHKLEVILRKHNHFQDN